MRETVIIKVFFHKVKRPWRFNDFLRKTEKGKYLIRFHWENGFDIFDCYIDKKTEVTILGPTPFIKMPGMPERLEFSGSLKGVLYWKDFKRVKLCLMKKLE